MAKDLDGRRILIMASDGFEQSELMVPHDDLQKAGATVEIAAPEAGKITGWHGKDWGKSVKAGLAIDDVTEADWDALVLPGGQMNPDTLRANPKAVALVKAFHDAGKPVAAVCHAPWLLIEAGLAQGRRMTGYKSIRTDLTNAGAVLVDESAVVDGNLITSRDPDDLPDFVEAITKALTA